MESLALHILRCPPSSTSLFPTAPSSAEDYDFLHGPLTPIRGVLQVLIEKSSLFFWSWRGGMSPSPSPQPTHTRKGTVQTETSLFTGMLEQLERVLTFSREQVKAPGEFDLPEPQGKNSRGFGLHRVGVSDSPEAQPRVSHFLSIFYKTLGRPFHFTENHWEGSTPSPFSLQTIPEVSHAWTHTSCRPGRGGRSWERASGSPALLLSHSVGHLYSDTFCYSLQCELQQMWLCQ